MKSAPGKDNRREKISWKAQGRWLDEVERNVKRTLKCRNWRSSSRR
jgi:hypothetical protein